MQTNPHEAAARARKVLRVVTYLQCGPLKVADLRATVPLQSNEWWERTALAAGIPPRKGRDWNKPLLSADTRADVIAELNRLSGEIARVA